MHGSSALYVLLVWGALTTPARSLKILITGDTPTGCALLDTDEHKCWGYNGYGQLGVGDTTARGNVPDQMGDNLLPINLGTSRTAVDFQFFQNTVCAMLDNNDLKC
jgi:hypothetical protein